MTAREALPLPLLVVCLLLTAAAAGARWSDPGVPVPAWQRPAPLLLAAAGFAVLAVLALAA